MLSKQELQEIELEIRQVFEKELQQATEECKQVLKNNLNKTVYEEYNPKFYNRTYELINSISYKIEGDEGIIFFDKSKMNHINNVGENVDDKLPIWLNQGWTHKNYNGAEDYYHKRHGAKFLQLTIEEMKVKYPDLTFNLEL